MKCQLIQIHNRLNGLCVFVNVALQAGQAYFISDDYPVNNFEFFRPLVSLNKLIWIIYLPTVEFGHQSSKGFREVSTTFPWELTKTDSTAWKKKLIAKCLFANDHTKDIRIIIIIVINFLITDWRSGIFISKDQTANKSNIYVW